MPLKLLVPSALAALCLFATGPACSKGGSDPAAPRAIGQGRQVTITDPVYGMTAATLEIPAGWKFAGTVARLGTCTSVGASIRYATESADGLTALEIFPGYAWSWSSDPAFARAMEKSGCAETKILSAGEFLQQIALPALRPGAKVVSVEPPAPEMQAKIAAQLAQMDQQTAQMAARFGQKMPRTILEGATVHLEGTHAGAPVDEALSTVIYCSVMEMPAMLPRARPTERHQCSASVISLARTPRGTMAMRWPELAAIGASFQADPEWTQRLSADQQRAAQQLLSAQQAQGRAILEQGEQAQRQRNANHEAFMQQQQTRFDHAMSADRARQAAIDHSAQQTSQAVLNQGTYVNPNTGQATVTSDQYNHTWQAQDGTVLHTNDHNFDPNGRDNQTWTELQPVK